MRTYAELAPSPAATLARRATTSAPPTRSRLPADRVLYMPHRVGGEPARIAYALRAEYVMSWRDLAQSFAHDAVEMPIVSRLLASQVVLALGYAGLRGALALREHRQTTRAGSALLAGLTAGMGLACTWAAFTLVARTRAAPAITAFFTYGHALSQYLPSRRPIARAA